MKTLNTTFRNFSLALGFLFVGFFSKAQNYEPLSLATSFVNGTDVANPNTGTDLWYDFGWRRNAASINFNSTNDLLTLTGSGNTNTITVTSVGFALTSAHSINVAYRQLGSGGSVQASRVIVRNTISNVERVVNLDATTTTSINILNGLFTGTNPLTPGSYVVEFQFRASGNSRSLEISNFSTDATPSILPVTYASFSAKSFVNTIKLDWATTNEVNNSHFEIERTNDGENWTTIGTVEGNGNTFSVTNYEFVDNTPAQGANIYRLKQVDWNGEFVYSVTKTVVWGGEIVKNNVQVYPNPSANVIHITGVDNPTVTIYNMAGSVMIQSSNTNSLDLQELVKGVYFIHVQNPAGEVSRIRFIKE